EVKPLKAALPAIVALRIDEAGRRFRRTLELVRTLGLATHLRGVEQTPETSFVIGAALDAYPEAQAVHIVRDGRDVVCSLLERGWLGTEAGTDHARPASRSPPPLPGQPRPAPPVRPPPA